MTDFEKEVDLLSDMWIGHNLEGAMAEFYDVHDIGIAVALLISVGVVDPKHVSQTGLSLMHQTHENLYAFLEVPYSHNHIEFAELLQDSPVVKFN